MKAKLKRRKKVFFVFVLFCFNGLGQAFDTLVKSPIRIPALHSGMPRFDSWMCI